MKVVLIEDDYLEAGQIKDLLGQQYQGVDIVDIATESDFVAAIPALEEDPPDLVVMDIMIPRHRPSLNIVAPPEEDVDHLSLRTGIRLLGMLQGNARLRNVPVIIHSALAWHDLEADLSNRPNHVLFVHKGAAPLELMAVLRALLSALGGLPKKRDESLGKRIWDALEASPSLGGFGLNLKKLIAPDRGRE
jgi:DNA-binding NarL/FixJ family response regulator